MTDTEIEKVLKVNNYNIASARIGVAAMFVPILWGMAALIAFDAGAVYWIGAPILFFIGGMLFIWQAIQVVLWVKITDERIVIRRVFKLRDYSRSMLQDAVYTKIPESILSKRRHKMLQLTFSTGEEIHLKVSGEVAQQALKKLCRSPR